MIIIGILMSILGAFSAITIDEKRKSLEHTWYKVVGTGEDLDLMFNCAVGVLIVGIIVVVIGIIQKMNQNTIKAIQADPTLSMSSQAQQQNMQQIMIRCTQCDELVEENAKFCPKCGGNMKKEVPQIRKCSSCGEEIGKNAMFCKRCGNKA